jgi:hypothetical protein
MLWMGEELTAASGPDVTRLAGWWREVAARWRRIAELLGAGLAGAGRAVGG